ncbi:hypothetical protein, partial [Megasphaera sp.]
MGLIDVADDIFGIGNRNFIIISSGKINKGAVFSGTKRMFPHIENKGFIDLVNTSNNSHGFIALRFSSNSIHDCHISCCSDLFIGLIYRNTIVFAYNSICTGYPRSIRPKRTTGIGTGYRHGQQHGQNTGSQYIPFLSFHCILSKHKKSEIRSFYSSINYFRSFIYI